MKKCSKCGEEKQPDCFNKNQYYCRPCQNGYSAKHYQANKEKCLATGKKYSKTLAGIAVCAKKQAKYNRSEHGSSVRKAYSQSKQGKLVNRLKASRRRARIKQNGVEHFSYEDLRIFWLGQNILDDRCYYCQKSLPDGPEHIDHYIPVAKGGSHTKVNLRPSCACCNRRKSDKHPIQFLQEITKWQL